MKVVLFLSSLLVGMEKNFVHKPLLKEKESVTTVQRVDKLRELQRYVENLQEEEIVFDDGDTPLLRACRERQWDSLHHILQKTKKTINAQGADKKTALIILCEHMQNDPNSSDDFFYARILLDMEGINLELTTDDGYSVLHALGLDQTQNNKFLIDLLKKGAPVLTPCTMHGRKSIVQEAYEKWLGPLNKEVYADIIPYFSSAPDVRRERQKNPFSVSYLMLLNKQALAQHTTNPYQELINLIRIGGHDDRITELINILKQQSLHGRSCCERSGWTPFHYAACCGRVDVLERLIKAHVTVDFGTPLLPESQEAQEVDEQDSDFGLRSICFDDEQLPLTVLDVAKENGYDEIVKVLEPFKSCYTIIDQNSGDLNTQGLLFPDARFSTLFGQNFTLLHRACSQGNLSYVRRLVKAGASCHLVDNKNMNALAYAACSKNPDMITFLLIKGALCKDATSGLLENKLTDALVFLKGLVPVDKLGVYDQRLQDQMKDELIGIPVKQGKQKESYQEYLTELVWKKRLDSIPLIGTLLEQMDCNTPLPTKSERTIGQLKSKIASSIKGTGDTMDMLRRLVDLLSSGIHKNLSEINCLISLLMKEKWPTASSTQMSFWQKLIFWKDVTDEQHGSTDIMKDLVMLQKQLDLLEPEKELNKSFIHWALSLKHPCSVSLVSRRKEFNPNQQTAGGSHPVMYLLELAADSRVDKKFVCAALKYLLQIEGTVIDETMLETAFDRGHLVLEAFLTDRVKAVMRGSKHQQLIEAVKNGDTEKVVHLINQGVHLKSRCLDNPQKDPLWYAVESGMIENVVALIHAGYQVDRSLQETEGCSYEFVAKNDQIGSLMSFYRILGIAVHRGIIDTVKIKLNETFDSNARFGPEGMTILHMACNNENSTMVDLVKHRCDINAQDYLGRTPLHIACSKKNFTIAEKLLNHTVTPQINSKDSRGMTPLAYAALAKHTELVKLLIARGASFSKAYEGLNRAAFKEGFSFLLSLVEANQPTTFTYYYGEKKEELKKEYYEAARRCSYDSWLLLAALAEYFGINEVVPSLEEESLNKLIIRAHRLIPGGSINPRLKPLVDALHAKSGVADYLIEDDPELQKAVDDVVAHLACVQDKRLIHWALDVKSEQVLRLVLNMPDVDVNVKTRAGHTPLLYILDFVEDDQFAAQAIDLLLAKPEIDLTVATNDSETLYEKVIKRSDFIIKKVLTPFVCAALRNVESKYQVFIDGVRNNQSLPDVIEGSYLRARCLYKPDYDALSWAVENNNNSMIYALVEAGFEVDRRLSNGSTYAERYSFMQKYIDLYHKVLAGDRKQIEQILSQDGENKVSPNARYGALLKTPLLIASERNEAAVVEELLRWGADPNRADKQGNTPLVVASKLVAEYLVTYGARFDKACKSLVDKDSLPLLLAKMHCTGYEQQALTGVSDDSVYEHFKSGAEINDICRIAALAENLVDINAPLFNGQSLVFKVVDEANVRLFEFLVRHSNFDPNVVGKDRLPLLMYMVSTIHNLEFKAQVLPLLMKLKALDKKVLNGQGCNALMIALVQDSRLAELLAEHGVEIQSIALPLLDVLQRCHICIKSSCGHEK